jgi:hypothetical protein
MRRSSTICLDLQDRNESTFQTKNILTTKALN